jgi:hypothetical protein
VPPSSRVAEPPADFDASFRPRFFTPPLHYFMRVRRAARRLRHDMPFADAASAMPLIDFVPLVFTLMILPLQISFATYPIFPSSFEIAAPDVYDAHAHGAMSAR